MLRYSQYRNFRYWMLITEFHNQPLEKNHSDIARNLKRTHSFTDKEIRFLKGIKQLVKVINFNRKADVEQGPTKALAWYTHATAPSERTVHIYAPIRWLTKDGYLATLAHEVGHFMHMNYSTSHHTNDSLREVVAELFSLELLCFLEIDVNEHRGIDYLSGNIYNVRMTEKEFVKLHKFVIKLVNLFIEKAQL